MTTQEQTHPTTTGTRLARPVLALTTAILVMLSGLMIIPSASAAAAPSATATVSAAAEGRLSVHVDFFDVPPSTLRPPQNMGVYTALVDRRTGAPAGQGAFVANAGIVDGAGSSDFDVTPADGLRRDAEYDLLIWYAHGNPGPDANILQQAFPIAESQWDAVFPPAPEPTPTATTLTSSASSVEAGTRVTLTARVAPAAAGAVAFTDGAAVLGTVQTDARGTASLATDALSVGAHSIVAAFTAADQGAFADSRSGSVAVNVTPKSTPPAEGETGSFSWGVKRSFVNYVENLSGDGVVTVSAPAKRSGNLFAFPQSSDAGWNAEAGTGSVQYAGAVSFSAHAGALGFALANPKIVVLSDARAQLVVTSGGAAVTVADLDLAKGTRTSAGGTVSWSGVPATLTAAGVPIFQQYPAGTELDPVSFTVGESASVDPVDPPVVKPPKKPKPGTPTRPRRPSDAKAAGSLAWGISSGFAGYTTGNIAKGRITTQGVGSSGGSYLFPQAAGGDWNFKTQTGTVRYSGVVAFLGHEIGGSYLMNESFANPTITVTGPTTGTISAGGRSFALDLGAATKSVDASGAVTWRDVPVRGAISGGGGSGGSRGGGSFAVDPLSFTVGAAAANRFGSSTVSHPSKTREAAATPPSTTGITVLTPADQLVAGGEIEFEASGFEANERDILVVMYSKPIVLDRNAGADDAGTVRWVGTLPRKLSGEHTITLQGSTAAGAVIDILTPDEFDAAHPEPGAITGGERVEQPNAAGTAPAGDASDWQLWVGAIALLVIAGGMTGLVVRQRRAARASA